MMMCSHMHTALCDLLSTSKVIISSRASQLNDEAGMVAPILQRNTEAHRGESLRHSKSSMQS